MRNSYYEEISPNIWLMDNHKWAFFAWENYLHASDIHSPMTLIHFDFHWDGVNDFNDDSEKKILEDINNLEEIKRIIEENRLIKYDSYIAPAIIRRLINEVHFYCFQIDTEIGLNSPLLEEYDSKQIIHSEIQEIVNYEYNQQIIFNLDLDLFNKSDMYLEGDLWSEVEILHFLEDCSTIVNNSAVITIAKSTGLSGTEDDTNYLVDLIVPKIEKYFTA